MRSMINFKAFTPLFIGTYLLVIGVVFPNKYRIMTEELPPWSFKENQRISGIAVEVVREMLVTLAIPNTIKIYPWQRAYRMTLERKNNILFSMAKTPERTPLFKWVGPIATEKVYFYQNRKSNVQLNQLSDAKKVKTILTARGFPEHSYLQSKGFSNLHITASMGKSFQMLAHQRGDLTVSGETTGNYFLTKENIDKNTIVESEFSIYQFDLYIAFSRNISNTEIEKWQKALDTIKESGRFAEIVNKYTQP